jgi:hypothetical protein
LLAKYGNDSQQLFVQFIVTDFNEEELEPFKEFWTAKGVNVKIRPKLSWAGLVEAANLRDNSEVERKPCYWLMRLLPICADGRAALCGTDLRCPLDLGNAMTMTIKEIWKGKLKGYRKMHLERRFDQLPDLCRNCRDWQSGYADFVLSEDSASD